MSSPPDSESRRALQHLLGEAEALHDPAEAVAVAVPARGLEAPLELLVRLHGVAKLRAVLGEAGEPLLGRAQRRLELHGFAERLQEVVAHGAVALQLRRLLVEPDPAAAGAGDGARVGGLVAGDEAQQRRLAGAVAAHEHGVVVPVDGEGDGGEQPLAGEGLLDVVEGDDAHGVARRWMGAGGSGRIPPAARGRQRVPGAGPLLPLPGLASQGGGAPVTALRTKDILIGPRTTVFALLGAIRASSPFSWRATEGSRRWPTFARAPGGRAS